MLDFTRFAALWGRLGLGGDPRPTFDALARAYAEPARAYHTAEHIRDCLAQFDLEPGLAAHPDEVEFALWFHDAIYEPMAADNEERSAAWAAEALAAAGAPAEVRERLRGLILATRHDASPTDRDAQVIADVDLSILGRDEAAFTEFERRIRAEYAWVPEAVYAQARADVLARFLERQPLYHHEGFRQRYERAAKHNLRIAVDRLASFL